MALFPDLVAGPIIRYKTLAEQLASRDHTLRRFASGVLIFIVGFAKKILLANPMGQVADATDAEVDQAIDLANKARKGWWRQDSRSRAVTLHDIAATIRRDKALYAEALTREEGKPFKEAVDEVSWCATAIDYYAELARHETGRIAGTTVPGQFHFAVKEPLGTVIIILPFNYPLVLLCWEAAYNLIYKRHS